MEEFISRFIKVDDEHKFRECTSCNISVLYKISNTMIEKINDSNIN